MTKLFHNDRALDIIRDAGPMSITAWARACLDDGHVFTEEFFASASLASAKSCLNNLARSSDSTGLPRMGRTTQTDEEGDALWEQREFWSLDTYTFNVSVRLDMADANTAIAVALARECVVRYGRPPEDDRLPGLDYGDATEEDAWR